MKTLMIIQTAHGGLYFSITYLTAFLLAAGIGIYAGFRKGYPRSTWLLISLTGVLFFIIGNKILTYSPEQWVQVFTRFYLPAADKKTVLGGILGLFAGVYIAKTWLRFNRPVIDTLAVALPLAMAISRIGCLFAGCCFGSPTNLPWGIQYDPASWVYHAHLVQGMVDLHDKVSLAVHPVQFYQVIGCLVIAFIVWKSRKQWKSDGSLFLFSVLCYGFLRFFVEFVRAPETNFYAGQQFWGLKIIQWLILGALLPGIFFLIYRETKLKPVLKIHRPVFISEKRQILLAFFLSTILLMGRKWFDLTEISTILLFYIPIVVFQLVEIYHRHSVAGFRLILPAILVCSLCFMAQKSNTTGKQDNKITFTEIGVSGIFGKYAEELQQVRLTCGGPDYHTISNQSIPFYQAGMNVSYNIWKGRYTRFTFGGRLFYGEESPRQTVIYSGTNRIYGISPYASLNWRVFGFSAGFTLGQIKIPFGKRAIKLQDGEVIAKGQTWVSFFPSCELRLGPVDVIYFESSFPGFYPFSTPYPTFQAGLGSGLGKTNGTKVSVGYCYQGIYGELVYPITNRILLSAAYADNFQTGDKASRIFSFGFNYKFLDENKYKEQLKVSSLPYHSTVRGSGRIKKLPAYVKDPDSNQYKTIAVGDQVWMAKNLKTGHYCDGTKIPGVDDITSENGRLYTWNDVNHSGKLCPAGWHVPSRTEWISLFNSLSGKKGEASILAKIFDGGAPTGQWWSSTEQDAEQANSIYLNNGTVGIMFVNSAKTTAFSVRCIRDH